MTADKIRQVAAECRGPGPGVYCPNINKIRKAAPCHSFGTKQAKDISKIDDSPGPKFGVDPAMTSKGKANPPAPTLGARGKDPIKFNTPGPGAYQVEKCAVPGEKRSPASIMGCRTAYKRKDAVPAPSSYSLPTTLGFKVPSCKGSFAFTFTSPKEHGSYAQDLAKTPGPSAYARHNDDVNRKKQPACSLGSRNVLPGDQTLKPGPGSHDIEKAMNATRKKAAAVSMGIRPSPYTCPLIIAD